MGSLKYCITYQAESFAFKSSLNSKNEVTYSMTDPTCDDSICMTNYSLNEENQSTTDAQTHFP
jgi:hypothetical protein